jgi:hypothetical protein
MPMGGSKYPLDAISSAHSSATRTRAAIGGSARESQSPCNRYRRASSRFRNSTAGIRGSYLREDVFNDVAVNVGQAIIAALKPVRQLRVIEAELL